MSRTGGLAPASVRGSHDTGLRSMGFSSLVVFHVFCWLSTLLFNFVFMRADLAKRKVRKPTRCSLPVGHSTTP